MLLYESTLCVFVCVCVWHVCVCVSSFVIPGQVVPLSGHLVEEFLHGSHTVMVLPAPLHVLTPLTLQLFSPLPQLLPGPPQTSHLLQGRGGLALRQPSHSLPQLGDVELLHSELLEELLVE